MQGATLSFKHKKYTPINNTSAFINYTTAIQTQLQLYNKQVCSHHIILYKVLQYEVHIYIHI